MNFSVCVSSHQISQTAEHFIDEDNELFPFIGILSSLVVTNLCHLGSRLVRSWTGSCTEVDNTADGLCIQTSLLCILEDVI